jgi:acetylornithine deacetylase/succinyl-diaminopimelate desuccinylase-like protein
MGKMLIWQLKRIAHSAGPRFASEAAGQGRLHRARKRGDVNNLKDLRAIAALVLAACLSANAARAADLDWHEIGDETADLLANILRIDTTNPPGGEIAAANALARKLEAAGIHAEVFESAPGRGNLCARLPGRGPERPLVLLSHLDVVPADTHGWRLAPFAGARDGDYLYGRGALDAKGVTAIQAMTLIVLERMGVRLDRDLILLATADEETGGKAGAGWIAQHRADLLRDAEYLITEGDHIHAGRGGSRVVQVAVAEKTPCWVRLTAHGEAGHGATPPPQTAVTRLIRALNKIRRFQAPVRVVRPVEEYFAALARLEDEPLRSRLAHLGEALEDPTFLTEFTRNPRQNALVRDTITPTVLIGSPKTNVIPAEASAQLDCRLLPGEKPAEFLALLRDVIGDESIQVEPLLSFPASSSDASTAFMAAVRQLAAKHLGGVPVVPSVIPGFTDSHYFRELGIASYGFVPFILSEDEEKAIHGINERVSVQNLRGGVQRMVTLVRALQPGQTP